MPVGDKSITAFDGASTSIWAKHIMLMAPWEHEQVKHDLHGTEWQKKKKEKRRGLRND